MLQIYLFTIPLNILMYWKASVCVHVYNTYISQLPKYNTHKTLFLTEIL